MTFGSSPVPFFEGSLIRLLLAIGFLGCVGWLRADPFSDLASPSPEIRAHAAEIIRDQHLFKRSPRTPWDKMAVHLEVGAPIEKVLPVLQQMGIAEMRSPTDFSMNGVYYFQLDDTWALRCAINHSILIEYRISEDPRIIDVEPPPGYNGFWRTYRINGEALPVIYYQNGKGEVLEGR